MNTTIQSILNDIFLNDILQTMKEHHFHKYSLTMDQFEDTVRRMIKNHPEFMNILDINPDENKWLSMNKKYISRRSYKTKKNKCLCRIWNNGYGGQCSNNSKVDHLCMRHYNMLKKDNILPFGYITESRPEYNLKNMDKLPWKDKQVCKRTENSNQSS